MPVRRPSRLRGLLPWLVVAAGLALAVVSLLAGLRGRAVPVDRGAVPLPASPTVAGSAPAPSAPATTGSYPTGVTIAKLDVRAAVVPVAVTAGGALVVPDDIHTVGWWAGGALPGSATGSAVFDGHVDSAAGGPGALFRLSSLRVGAMVIVTGSLSSVTYRITGLREYDKGNLPAASLFTVAGPPRLVLVTCGGPFDAATHHYRDNVVAFGVPIPAP